MAEIIQKTIVYELLEYVGIARSLSHNPDMIIADKPTENLDSDTEQS